MKILHLIEKGTGLQQAPEGHLESFLWLLDTDELAADYVALHKQKSQRSWKGGPIREYNGRPGLPWGGVRKGTMAYKSLETVDEGSAGKRLDS